MSSKEQAQAQYDEILLLLLNLEENPRNTEEIHENVLSVQIRSDWEQSAKELKPHEYELLLVTGGPACRIIGTLSDGEPATARLQHQDWGTPWTDFYEADEDVLLQYAQHFYFGE